MKLTLPIKPHDKQKLLVNTTARYNVIAAGRRFGKTEACKLSAIYDVMQGKTVWWVNPTFGNTINSWRTFVNFFSQFVDKQGNINHSNREILVPNFGSLQCVGANNFKRGDGVDKFYFDEAAFIPNLQELWEGELQPMLLTTRGEATFLSSTNGRNYFWQLYQKAKDPLNTDWQAWHFTSYDTPYTSNDEIDKLRQNITEAYFRQEYLAEFLDDAGTVFRNLSNCVTDKLVTESRHDCIMGVDWGRHNDYTVLTVIDSMTGQVVDIDRFNQIDWQLQRGRLVQLYDHWRPIRIIAEQNSIGEPNIEELVSQGLPVEGFQTTNKSKHQIINQLALAFEQETIMIPDDPTLLGELQAYGIERLPSGNTRYSAPPGVHDDMVMSLALAWHGALTRKPNVVWG